MFAVRALDFRRDVDGKMVLKHINKDSRNTAVFMQTCGTVAEMLCAQCSQGCGPFEACIVLERDRVRPIGPTCANCYFNGEGHICSFCSVPIKISDDKINSSQFAVANTTPIQQSTQVSQLKKQAQIEIQGSLLTSRQKKRAEDLFVSAKPSSASLLVSYRVPLAREAIQPQRPGQSLGVEYSSWPDVPGWKRSQHACNGATGRQCGVTVSGVRRFGSFRGNPGSLSQESRVPGLFQVG